MASGDLDWLKRFSAEKGLSLTYTPEGIQEAIASVPAKELPERWGRYSRRKSESVEEYQVRVVDMVAEGRIDLLKAAKSKGKSKDPFLARSEAVLTALSNLGVWETDAQKKYAYDAVTPALSKLVTATETLARKVSIDDSYGLYGVRDLIAQWVESTYDLKYEEAFCNLECYRCPSGQVLNCAVDNLTSAPADGFDIHALIHLPNMLIHNTKLEDNL